MNAAHTSSRRDFLRRTGLVTLAAGSAGTAVGALPAHAAEGSIYLDRATWDAWLEQYFRERKEGMPDEPNDDTVKPRSGGLGWGASYLLAALMRMYHAYGDTRYLDRMIESTDAVLSMRDSERGVTDYRGRSLPAWRATDPYTVGTVDLVDADGRPSLQVRAGRVYSGSTSVTVIAGATADRFDLDIRHAQSGNRRVHTGLSMDPASPDYAVRRLYGAYPAVVLVTALDLRETPAAAGVPAPGTFRMTSLPTIFAVHTGMITLPIAHFVRTVLHTPKLLLNRRYRIKALEYLFAVRAAVAVHDAEYRVTENGEGTLIWLKGSPQQWDGSEQPINQTLSWGQTIAELAMITGERRYRERTAAMATMLRGQLALDASRDSYSWHYWPTFGNIYNGYAKTGSPETDVSIYNPNLATPQRQIEDISHAAIAVEFAGIAYKARLGLTRPEMERLTRTFTRNVARQQDGIGASTYLRVNGTVNANFEYAGQAPRWMQLAAWDPAVYQHSLAVFEAYEPSPESLDGVYGWVLGNLAYLHQYARRGRV
jgi:hypothetical protein